VRFDHLKYLGVSLAAAFAVGCSSASSETGDDQNATSANTKNVDISAFDFDLPTPSGKRLFQSMVFWTENQTDNFAVSLGCAKNVSHVFGLTLDVKGASAISPLQSAPNQRVEALLARAKSTGAKVVVMPKDLDNPLNPTPFIAKLNEIHNGRIPVGTIITGCTQIGCTGAGGDNHAGMIGETDDDGVLWIYHNNWTRPDDWDDHPDDESLWGPEWEENMVPKENLRRGLARKFMKTPWIKVTRGPDGLIETLESLNPDLDDLFAVGDANNADDAMFHIHLVIPKVIEDEIAAAPPPVPPAPPDDPVASADTPGEDQNQR
jgi:hypothetical protein